MKYRIYITICSLLLSLTNIYGQLSNEGVLTIESNTEVSILEDFNNSATGNVLQNGDLYIHQSFTNNGQFSYLSTVREGTIHFVGTALQQVISPAMSVFYDVVFDNSAVGTAFQLNGSLFVENEVDFLMGVLENNALTNSFVFGRDAIHINTSNASYIDGAVQKEGDVAFDFPVGGDGFYRRLEISAPGDQTDLFSAEYFPENSNVNYPHDLSVGVIKFMNTNEYWTLTRESGSSNVVITLTWDEDVTSAEVLNGPSSDIHIVRWDEDQGFWVDEGGIVDEVNKTVTTFTQVSDYGVFTLARVKENQVLPGNIVVYNLITPDGDGKNDFLRIEGLERGTDNTVEIFNRYGVKVFETENYDNGSNSFRGFSDGRATLNRGEQVPTGTYYYILNYTYNSQRVRKAGFLYVNGKQ